MLRPTVGLPVCIDVRYPSGTHDRICIAVREVVGLLMLGSLSDERMSLQLTTAAGPSQRSYYWIRVPQDSILLSQIWDSPSPGGSGFRIYFPQERGILVILPGIGLVC
jgi:hypothetical protein